MSVASFCNVFPLFEITGFGLSKSSGMFHVEEKNAMDFMCSSYFYRNFPERKECEHNIWGVQCSTILGYSRY